jgi:hypothetical protein
VWCADDSVTKDSPPCADAIFLKPVDPHKLQEQLYSLRPEATAKAPRRKADSGALKSHGQSSSSVQ